VVALQRVLQRRHERLPLVGHGRQAAAVDVDVLDHLRGRRILRRAPYAIDATPQLTRIVDIRPAKAAAHKTKDATAAPATRRLRLVGSCFFARGADSSVGIVLWSVIVVFRACVEARQLSFALDGVVLSAVPYGVEGSGTCTTVLECRIRESPPRAGKVYQLISA
jgi:hypothetical protein